MNSLVISILKHNYEKTKWNYYPMLQIIRETGVTRDQLNQMYKDGLIDVSQSRNDKLIMLKL